MQEPENIEPVVQQTPEPEVPTQDEYLEGWKRAKADLLNYKRDEAQRFTAVVKSANESLVREIVVVFDGFDVAIASLKEGDPARTGMQLIRAQLEEILKRAGIEIIVVAPGDQFNPAFHEAVTEIFSGEPPGTVARELNRGYVLGGRVVRASRVVLSKGPSGEEQPTNK